MNPWRVWPWLLGLMGVAVAAVVAHLLGVHLLWQDVAMVTLDVGGIIIGFEDAFDMKSPFTRKDHFWLWACEAMALIDLSLGLVLTFFAWQPYVVFLVVKKFRRAGGAAA